MSVFLVNFCFLENKFLQSISFPGYGAGVARMWGQRTVNRTRAAYNLVALAAAFQFL